jgi:hypothetical protein
MMVKVNARRSMSEARPVVTLARALCDEYRAIHGEDVPPTTEHSPDAIEQAYRAAAAGKKQAALCLSGGGIRSATYSLGVIQALARKGLLTRFHYLSTVSGGGYAGAWLSALTLGAGGDFEAVQRLLAAPETPRQVANLREYTNYLTPQPGLASPDTWTGILLWIRNVLINWMVFLPALFAAALVPIVYRDLLSSLSSWLSWPLFVIGILALGVAVYRGAVHIPSHLSPARAATAARSRSGDQEARFVQQWIVRPLLGWAFLVPVIAAPSLRRIMPSGAVPLSLIPLASFLVMIAAYLVAAWREDPVHRQVFLHNFGWWTLASLIAAFLLGLGLDLGLDAEPEVIAVLGPLWVTVAHLMQSLFYVALRSEAFRGDLDREWLARLNAEKVIPALIWALFAVVCLVLPMLVLEQWTTTFRPWVLGVIGFLSGPVAAFLGKSAAAAAGVGDQSRTRRFSLPLNVIIAIATAIFAVVLFMLLAWAAAAAVDFLAPVHGGVTPGLRIAVEIAIGVAAYLISWFLGRRINVNRFSMHAVYRNRLIRAYLGSARQERHPDGFTGLDAHDNPRMADLLPLPDGKALFHVVNVALNLVGGRNNAWAERKAESFTITPLACGSAYLHRSEDVAAGKGPRGAYVNTAVYGGNERETGSDDRRNGTTLGTAITLSGAAVSPNMGYHSSPATAFLMTLFNVRLGAWLANPASASAEALREPKPPNALFALAREMLGLTTDRGAAVYLSDGGHFENLGIYEMVRRRCRYIVVVDADADPSAGFADLGNAVRKSFIDQNIEILFSPTVSIGSRSNPAELALDYAYAKISYPEGTIGELIYIKPCYLPDVPIDVRAYGATSKAFPQEPTVEQWFSESQFESYRRLGEYQMSALGQQKCETMAGFFADVLFQLNEAHGVTRARAAAPVNASD